MTFINDIKTKSLQFFSTAAWNFITSIFISLSEFALIRIWTLVLYGTVKSPQKTDETRQSSSSPVLLYNNNNFSLNTFYRPNANYGTTSLYINRKQQKTTSTAPTTRKNGSKQKGNKNRTSTERPIYTTVNQQFSVSGKSTKNKSKSTSTNFSRQTSTVRPPRTSSAKPSTKIQMNFDGGKASNNNNLLSPKGDKVQSNSNIYEKPPGNGRFSSKVNKENLSFLTTQSPMSKMFERYGTEKIQEIYPELKPYKDSNNPAYFTSSNSNGNGKPSRENSKSFSSFVSVNSALQKKNSPNQEQQKTANKQGENSRRFFFACNCFFFFNSNFFLEKAC